MRLDHVQIAAPPGCESAARRFFGDLLGLQELEKPKALSGRGGVWFALDGQQLHVGVEGSFSPALKAHPALRVSPEELDALALRLGTADAEVLWDDSLPGERRFYSQEEIFAEVTFHAAYEPQRAVRTERWKYIRRFDDYPGPVLANCDDSESKDQLVAAGWGEREVPRERLYDLVLDPTEADDLAARPEFAEQLADLRDRLERWMHETDDPLLDGPVEPPPGALVNEQQQVSPNEPLRVVSSDPTAAPSN